MSRVLEAGWLTSSAGFPIKVNALKPHPAKRFSAPSAINYGVPLKDLMGRRLVTLTCESFSEVVHVIDVKRFQKHDPITKSGSE